MRDKKEKTYCRKFGTGASCVCAKRTCVHIHILQNTSTGSRRLEILFRGNKLRRDATIKREIFRFVFPYRYSIKRAHIFPHTYTQYTLHRYIYIIYNSTPSKVVSLKTSTRTVDFREESTIDSRLQACRKHISFECNFSIFIMRSLDILKENIIFRQQRRSYGHHLPV
ncbi:hypothetical protein PUN28_008681 [Cardiocondyla obscurior]|uniref:Uncharacterized protein n=1 Tax=Cardiocondyla obscurior TaxID=286306 RepID=A0AAW2G4U9_9HYME